ncbi:proteasomal ubiquitin receptor ADRM1 homolog isoform X1 [Drosophila novamexicana]|uniref:proteasomal ubiquitin receptor ADRM1 homolog isoform X1 n=1 Tax=Drosophila novamexicana TaxID=47314 RepID=UPI0011E5988B|nr:proteasomal ubiquitin receptor ADRM1 homolog isoform X1 [Drosophila novamexicana]
MFGRQSGLGSSNSSNLVEFRAGRMNMVGKMVHPDTRKGLVYMTQSDDGLMHFCWKDRTSGKVEDDLIVFPDDFEYTRVDQCKSGRIYVLKFKSSSRRMFFWMQEPKTDKDEEHCRRINELLNNPPSAHQRGGGGSGSEGTDLQYMLNNMSQQQLMQLFGGVGQMGGLSSLLGQMNSRTPSSRNTAASSGGGGSAGSAALQTPENVSVPRTASAPSKPNKSGNSRSSSSAGGVTSLQSDAAGGASLAVDADASGKKTTNATTAATSGAYANPFQAYLSNLSPEHGAGRSLNIDLSTALSGAEAINQLIADPERVKSLIVHLPESEDADEDRKQQIKDHISSPQFQQALAQFSNALQSAQLGPVVKQFELSHEAVSAAYSGNLEEFVRALEKSLPAGASMAGDEATPNAAAAVAKDTPVADKKTEAEPAKEESAAAADKPDEKQK